MGLPQLASHANSEELYLKLESTPIITVPADMDIRYVARLIYKVGIRRAPVEDGGELIGMISLSSLILDNELF